MCRRRVWQHHSQVLLLTPSQDVGSLTVADRFPLSDGSGSDVRNPALCRTLESVNIQSPHLPNRISHVGMEILPSKHSGGEPAFTCVPVFSIPKSLSKQETE